MSKIWCVPSTKAYLCWETLTPTFNFFIYVKE
jgi:hypothetical protein